MNNLADLPGKRDWDESGTAKGRKKRGGTKMTLIRREGGACRNYQVCRKNDFSEADLAVAELGDPRRVSVKIEVLMV